jgi:aminoglycoside 6-adenylyltransferase
MRSENEMLELILNFAKLDDRIRLVLMNGSRVDPSATHDQFCDFDIVYFVRNIKSFTKDESWIETNFGKILILQKPDDWFSHPYDYESNQPFAYLIQFLDGNRIDLTLVDLENIGNYTSEASGEPSRILLQKDPIQGVTDYDKFDKFYVRLPNKKEFMDTCNEFYWLAPYVSKGIIRKELIYVKTIMETVQFEQLYKLLNWSVATRFKTPVRIGKFSKNLHRYLKSKDYEDLLNCFSGADFEDIWGKEINAIRLFHRHAQVVAGFMDFPYDDQLESKIIHFLESVKIDHKF